MIGLVVAAWSLLLLAWLTLHWGILPHIEQWRPAIEQRASRAIGAPVRIGRIELRSSGWVPSVELQQVSLHDAQSRPALVLPRVVAAFSVRSLLSLQLRFEQLLIDGAQLEVRRDAAGHVFVAGLDLSGPASNDRSAANWFFSQREFVIRGGALRWTDESRDAPPLALSDVHFVVRNTLRRHELRIDATPPAEWGDRFTLRARFTQPLLSERGDWRQWSGEAFADLPRADVGELRRHVDLPFEPIDGGGALRAWLDLRRGDLRGATVDLALDALTLRLAPEVEPLALRRVEGRFVGSRDDAGFSVAAERFGFETGDGLRWPRGDAALQWRHANAESPGGGEFSAGRLDLALMASVASRVPLGAPLRRLLDNLRPEGIVSGLQGGWEGPLDAPARYRVKGAIDGLTLASEASGDPLAAGRPGLRHASMTIEADETGGQGRLGIDDGALEFPGVFEDPVLPMRQLAAQLQWKVAPSKQAGEAPKVTLQVRRASFANDDARGALDATWSTGPGTGTARGGRYPGRLEMSGTLTDGVGARVARYLPVGIPADARSYVERAVRAGTIRSASFRVKGDLWDFPFDTLRNPKDGDFHIAGKVEGVELAYVPDEPGHGDLPGWTSPWPALTQISGELVFDRASMEIRNAQAQMYGVQLTKVQGGIRNLGDHAVLAIEGGGRGPLADMLRFVASSPVGEWSGRMLSQASGSGSADLKLALTIPLERVDDSTVRGSVTLAGNDLRLGAEVPALGAARGRVDFTHKGFSVSGASARMLGGDTSFSGGLQPDGAMRFSGQGSITAEALRRATELGPASRVAAALSGQTAWKATLGVVHGRTELNVSSNLVGLGIDLPAPLHKAPEAALPLRLSTAVEAPAGGPPGVVGAGAGPGTSANAAPGTAPATMNGNTPGTTPGTTPGNIPVNPTGVAPGANATPNGAATAGNSAAAPRDLLRFELGTLVQAQYQRDLSGDSPRVLRGSLAVGGVELPALPAAGVTASVQLASLDTDAWSAQAARLSPPGAGDDPLASGYAPTSVGLRAQTLSTGSRRLTRVVAGLSQDDGLWRGNVGADQLEGYVEYRPARSGSNAASAAGRVYARLARLSLPKSDAEEVESLLDPKATSVPALDVVIDDLELRGKRLGRIEIVATNVASGDARDGSREPVREWQLSRLVVTLPEAKLVAFGRWLPEGSRRRASLDFKLDVSDSGALLDRLGTPGAVRAGKGSLAGQVAWYGSPLALDYASMGGKVKVAFDAGQFLKVEPGAARLLGVLSLQSLPRRLSLDFRDLFQQGFAFDNITGDLRIEQGVAHTNNLRMRGAQAVVLMEGSADLERETQDLRVVVVPEINAGTASLAYAVINPAIGLGTFLAQMVLRKPLAQAGTREFHVTGPWADPKVERVERKFTDALPDLDPAGPAASGVATTPPAGR